MGPVHRATGLSGDIWECFSRRAIVPKTLSTTPINGAFSLFQPEGESTTLGTSAEGSDPVNGINAFEKRFCVFDAVPSNVTVIREDRTVIFVNAALRRHVGDLRGRKCNETELGSEETCRGCPLEKGWPESAFPYSRVVRDDDDQLVELVTTRVKDPDTGISYYVCFERDVTQAAENERHIQRLASSLDQMGEAVSVLDTAGKVIYVNKAFEVMTGFRGADVTGMTSLDLVNKDHTPESVESMMRQASEHGWSGELTSVVKDGQRHFISVDATPVKDSAGDPLGVVAVFKDVTRTKTEKAELDKYRSQLEEKMEARTNELARRVSQLTTINKIGRVVTSILDPDELMGEFVKSIANGFNYTHVCILMMDKEHGELYYRSGYGIKFTRLSHDLRLKLKEGIVGHAAYFSETLVTGDVRSDPRYVPGEVEGIQSEMAVPITFRGELLGVLDIQSELKDAFSRSEVTLLEMLADILASAITTAATYTESKEREQALSVLDRISKQISFRLEPTVILDQVARDAALLLKAEKALIGLIDEGRNELRWVASYNVDKEVLTSRRFNSNKGITGRAMKRLKTEVVNDYDSDPEALEPGNRIFEMRSIVSAPLTVEGRGIGVINVYNKAADKGFTKSDALILSSLADHAAIALENANLLSSLNQRVRSQLALLDTAVSLQRQIDSSSIYETVADKLRDVTFYDAITIYKVDHARGLMVPQVAKGSYVEEIMSEVFPIGDGISGYVAKSGKAELVNETRKDDRVVQVSGTPVDQETLMAVPLKGKDLVIGVMTLYRDGGKIFTETDLETAQLFANQAAVAVENSELYGTTGLLLEESRRKVEQMAQVLELTTSVMYMDDIDALLQRITNAVVASFGFRRAHIALIDPSGETLTTHAMAGYPEWVGSGRSVPLSRVLLDLQEQFRICKSCFYVPFEKQTYGIETFDFLAHPELADKPRPGPDAWHERDVVDFALRDRSGRFIGYLLVDEPNDLKVPEKEQLETLEVLVGIAAIGVENSKLYGRQVFAVNEIALLNDLMTHDINNFNQGIMGYLELLLQDRRLNEGQRRYAEKALVQVRNNARLIDNIRKLAKVRAMTNKDFASVDVQPAVAAAIESVGKMYPDRDISVVSTIAPGFHFIRGNHYVSDLFLNIIQNAVKFDTAKRVRVEISCSDEHTMQGDYWQVSVTDRGRGIPDDRKRAVFERFATGMTGIKGFGLGLSIVNTIVEKFDGRIWVEDRIKGDFAKGAAFKVLFPKAAPPERVQVQEPAKPEAVTPSSSSSARLPP